MATRVRTINKIGKGKYIMSSWKASDYFIYKIFYYIFYVYYLIFKYCFYVPIKWTVLKIKNLVKIKK